MVESKRSISLSFPANSDWATLVQSAAGEASRVFGLSTERGSRLVMGAEELLLYLAEAAPGIEVALTLRRGATCVLAEFVFELAQADLSALNITASGAEAMADDMAAMPLLLASRMTDGYHVERQGRTTRLSLRVERGYPEADPLPAPPSRDIQGVVRVEPSQDADAVALACGMARAATEPHLVPTWFSTPGRVADMAAHGDLEVLLALDETDAICGMLCWEQTAERSVGFYGPYCFGDQDAVCRALAEELIRRLGRTANVVVTSHLATGDLSGFGFELLGRVPFVPPGATETVGVPVWFRHLREDSGTSLWAHPSLVPFLERICQELVLMREIRATSDHGAERADSSVFSAKLNRQLGEAVLSLMVSGPDDRENVARHVESLLQDGYRNIFFSLDLASGVQAALAGPLMEQGFEPVLFLPHGGRSDMVRLRYVHALD